MTTNTAPLARIVNASLAFLVNGDLIISSGAYGRVEDALAYARTMARDIAAGTVAYPEGETLLGVAITDVRTGEKWLVAVTAPTPVEAAATIIPTTYAEREAQAIADQGLCPMLDALTDNRIPHTIEQTGGFVMVIKVLAPCICRGPIPEDPCGHGETAAGCPVHGSETDRADAPWLGITNVGTEEDPNRWYLVDYEGWEDDGTPLEDGIDLADAIVAIEAWAEVTR